MVGPDDPVFPVVRSNAPVIERIRERRQTEDNLANELGKLIGRIVKSDSDGEKEETANQLREGIRQSLSEELGVDVEDIDDTFLDGLASDITTFSEQDVLRQSTLEDLGIPGGSEEESTSEERGGDEASQTETDLFEEEGSSE
jgi:hypothetical protein